MIMVRSCYRFKWFNILYKIVCKWHSQEDTMYEPWYMITTGKLEFEHHA